MQPRRSTPTGYTLRGWCTFVYSPITPPHHLSRMLNAVPNAADSVDLHLLDRLVDEGETVFPRRPETVRRALAALLAHGHVLFEDIPGVGKTTLARALTAALGLEFRRIQFT